jgi:SulP family sulfate permease
VEDIKRALKATRSDAAVMVVTFLVTVLINIEFSIYVGVLLSIGLHLAKTSRPRIYSVVPDVETGKMVTTDHAPDCCQIDITQIEGSLFFGSAAFVLEDFQRRLRNRPDVVNLLIRMHHVNLIDASGIHVLEMIHEDLHHRGGGIFFSGVNHRVFDVLNNSGLLRQLGHTRVHATSYKAIRQAMRESFCPAICAACPGQVFQECPELMLGRWEIFGKDVKPRICRLPGEGSPSAGRRERITSTQ